jgi:hypothetical protein
VLLLHHHCYIITPVIVNKSKLSYIPHFSPHQSASQTASRGGEAFKSRQICLLKEKLCIKNYLTVQTKNVNNYPGNRLEDKISSGFSKLYFDNELLF